MDGVRRSEIPSTLIPDCCVAAETTVQGINCTDQWRTGAHINVLPTRFRPLSDQLEQGNLTNRGRKRVVKRMRSVRSLPPGATVDLEANLEVVSGSLHKQTKAPLNLGRLDNRDNKRDRVYRYASTGKGVNAYILDKVQHRETIGRLK